MKKEMKGSLLLLLTAIIWGAAFVAQSEGLHIVGPFTMQAVRFCLAGLVLIPVALLRDKTGKTTNKPVTPEDKRKLLIAGLVCGVCLFLACSTQMHGLQYPSVTAGKSGFLTALYVIMVPLVSVFLGKKLSFRIWIGVVLSVVGLYFLCLKDSLHLGKGELLTLVCSVFFTFHILCVDRLTKDVDGVRFSALQFFVTSALSAIGMFIWEKPDVSAILQCWLPICYAGICSGGIGYTLQIFGQQNTRPAIASILMSFEAVFAALFGWVLIGQELSPRELLGCGIMFCAIIIAQLPGRQKTKVTEK